jgi:hypothetical protein
VEKMSDDMGISRSDYYDWLKWPQGHRERDNEQLPRHILDIHRESDETYGSYRMTRALKKGYMMLHETCGKSKAQEFTD